MIVLSFLTLVLSSCQNAQTFLFQFLFLPSSFLPLASSPTITINVIGRKSRIPVPVVLVALFIYPPFGYIGERKKTMLRTTPINVRSDHVRHTMEMVEPRPPTHLRFKRRSMQTRKKIFIRRLEWIITRDKHTVHNMDENGFFFE